MPRRGKGRDADAARDVRRGGAREASVPTSGETRTFGLIYRTDGEDVIRRLRPAGRPRVAAILVGVLLLAGATAACEPVTAAGGGSTGTAPSAVDLGKCPLLSRGRTGQVDCVKKLQRALRANGYPSQPDNGVFGPLTEQNLRDFQRRHGIQPASGVFGPQTRAVLAGGGRSADPAVPRATLSSYSSRSYCTDSVCNFYLRRSTTRRYAQLAGDHPRIAAVVAGTILLGACGVLATKIVRAVCGILGGSYADDIGDDLGAAARQGACLRVSIGPTSGPGGAWKLLDSDPDNGGRCAD
jgi:peptidoglycan hydrolase-like protein with peptidoglycan-binding domain